MIASFVRPDRPDEVVARATWAGPEVRVEADDDAIRATVARIFRPTAVVVDDPALRTAGTRGPVLLPPGSLRWFLAAARARSDAEGLAVSFAPSEGSRAVAWDPAGAYRTFGGQVERIERSAAARD